MKYEIELTYEDARTLAGDIAVASGCACLRCVVIRAVGQAVHANPPRMEEPGWGEKVIAHWDAYPSKPREVWLRTCAGWENGSGLQIRWDALADPEPWTAES